MSKSLPTNDLSYSKKLVVESFIWWKKIFNVQAPYRWNLRRLKPGFTLDIGCGIGRNLAHLDGNGIGIDRNPYSIEIAKSRGFKACTVSEFDRSLWNKPGTFDSILVSHVLEHLDEKSGGKLLKNYLPLLKERGKVIIITPQEAGFHSDATHKEFMDFTKIHRLLQNVGLKILRSYSFPFPRFLGYIFKDNEFVVVGTLQQPNRSEFNLS